MKNLKFVLIAAFALSVMTTSCKKEKQPEPTPAATTALTTSSISLSLSIVEITDQAPMFASPNFKILDASGNVDSTGTLPVNASAVSSAYPTGDYCSIPSLTSITFSRVISNTDFYRVEVYSGTTLIRKWKVTYNNVVDEGATGVGKICGYSPHQVLVGL